MTNYEKIEYIKATLERPLMVDSNVVSLMECEKSLRYLKEVSRHFKIKKESIKKGGY
jgi:hypothetical protein